MAMVVMATALADVMMMMTATAMVAALVMTIALVLVVLAMAAEDRPAEASMALQARTPMEAAIVATMTTSLSAYESPMECT